MQRRGASERTEKEEEEEEEEEEAAAATREVSAAGKSHREVIIDDEVKAIQLEPSCPVAEPYPRPDRSDRVQHLPVDLRQHVSVKVDLLVVLPQVILEVVEEHLVLLEVRLVVLRLRGDAMVGQVRERVLQVVRHVRVGREPQHPLLVHVQPQLHIQHSPHSHVELEPVDQQGVLNVLLHRYRLPCPAVGLVHPVHGHHTLQHLDTRPLAALARLCRPHVLIVSLLPCHHLLQERSALVLVPPHGRPPSHA
eukprot:753696-Hanusia_phi.AAC.1